MRFDTDIKRDVDSELKWNPEIDSADIATKVSDGAVTFYGFARNLRESHQAELTVKRIIGVGAVANDLAVRPQPGHMISDAQIARETLQALKRALPNSWDRIRPMVRDGRVVLEGVVHWQYVRAKAEGAVRQVPGVLELRNSITIAPAILDGDIASAVKAAFARSAVVDPNHVLVDVSGSTVTLTEVVRSWIERGEANDAVWSAPRVTDVMDLLTVRR